MCFALLLGLCTVADSGPKNASPEVLTEEQFLSLLKDKGKFKWEHKSVSFSISTTSVKDRDLVGVRLEKSVDGKVEYTLTARKARIVETNADTGQWEFVFDQGVIKTADAEAEFTGQQFGIPAPRKK
jgi:hypothetical protein